MKLVFQWNFFIFCMRYTFYKQKGSGYINTEWKLNTKLARNTLSEGN